MSPIEQFSEMLPVLHAAAHSIRNTFPEPASEQVRSDLLVSVGYAEAVVREYDAANLTEFFRRFSVAFEQSIPK